MPPLLDLAHRAAVVGLVGTGVWGIWLTGAVWKSRRDDSSIHGIITPTEAAAQRQQAEAFQAQQAEAKRAVPRSGMSGPRGLLQQASKPRTAGDGEKEV
ncbi:hypothetical protein FA09DRAFT_340864 [Tilletiopsis washingtonensis]|uniref:Uncharacterized protein n=1 Tax=Tilletiopsis washingtonensis TaxID=58919 RepID=A0A316Z2X6_9BASI|nr:hypothetical protein FA09DRAFT_340864 [Tilletiopsis washingtonensis]PWN95929.1 hypothetical protein FA09DRAFT_340864 [Tilletiopsis washingtonensis]